MKIQNGQGPSLHLITEEEMVRIRQIELDMLRQIRQICLNSHIAYFLIGGTLLGAVRHKGFIPWDDDIDIGMLRPDYERFLQVASGALDPGIKIVNYATDSFAGEPFTKIMDTRTVMREAFASEQAPAGVFVDIFPFDTVPGGRLEKARHRMVNYTLRKSILLRSEYHFFKTGWKAACYGLWKLAAKRLRRETLTGLYYRNAVKYGQKGTEYVVNLGGTYGYLRETVPLSWIQETCLLDFEGERFAAPVNYRDYLTRIYGDYMSLPPKERQIPGHSVIELKLEDS